MLPVSVCCCREKDSPAALSNSRLYHIATDRAPASDISREYRTALTALPASSSIHRRLSGGRGFFAAGGPGGRRACAPPPPAAERSSPAGAICYRRHGNQAGRPARLRSIFASQKSDATTFSPSTPERGGRQSGPVRRRDVYPSRPGTMPFLTRHGHSACGNCFLRVFCVVLVLSINQSVTSFY